ncbi:hypothetical protein GGI12_003679, partial [Dipsacomyces acuminosporus]
RRAEYDEKRRAVIAKRQRQDALSGQRKKMKSQLEKDEMAARQAREAERMRAQSMREEAARFRSESQREEWRHDKRMREQIRRMQENEAQMQAEGEQATSALDDVDELDRTIRIRWDNSEHPHTRESISKMFSVFGELEEVVVAPLSEHRQRKHKSSTKQSALLVFKSISAAHALMNVQHTGEQLGMFSRSWATSQEPEAVSRITGLSPRSKPSPQASTPSMGAAADSRFVIPEISEIDLHAIRGYSMQFEDFEAMTLMHMRGFNVHH